MNSKCVVWTRKWNGHVSCSVVQFFPEQFLTQVEGQRSGGECKLCIDMPFLGLLALPPAS